MEAKNRLNTNTIIGIFVILAGGLLLLRNFGYVPGEYLWYIFRWQTFLIVLGVVFYFNANNKTIGLTLAIVGILGWFPEIWPVLLIGVGLYLVFRKKINKTITQDSGMQDENYEPSKMLNDTSIFGGAKKTVQIDNFKGGNITAIFGGSEINFMDSTLAEGVHRLDVFFLFGGSNLMVPSDWNVSIQANSIFGGIKDKRIIQQSQVFDKNKQLIISGVILFGGGELKNYISF